MTFTFSPQAARSVGLGAATALLAVLLGAFGAHALRNTLGAEALGIWRTGVEYHFYAAFGLIGMGLFRAQLQGQGTGLQGTGTVPSLKLLDWAVRLMLAGVVLFSGSLYLLALTGVRVLGLVTPFGGLAFIAAWGLFAMGAWRAGRD
jgi:uncharacterized membrane protein YgdD (TMEM256/DUF423 family)